MQTQTTKLFALSLVMLVALGGCKKNKQTSNLKSSKTSSKKDQRKSSRNAHQLDLADDMQSFALDDNLTKSHNGNRTTDESSPLFSWENINAEQSKNQFKTLHFDFDNDSLKPSEEISLKHNVDEAKKMIKLGKTIVIEGHACHSAGSAAYNMAISERRARNVAQKFAEHGIDASNIKIAPRGQEMPVRKGGNKQEQWVNRRVETYAIDSN